MFRTPLINALVNYRQAMPGEAKTVEDILIFVKSHKNCFSRENQAGHVTGSAWLLNQTEDKVLLTHHKKLGRWLQLGGHADNNPDINAVALREAQEESGLQQIQCLTEHVFSVDIHLIPEHIGKFQVTPKHYHYDITYIFKAMDNSQYVVSDESNDLAWFSFAELQNLELDANVKRMMLKWQKFCHTDSI